MARIGLSRPYVARYAYDTVGDSVSYTDGILIGKAIEASLELNDSGDNILYADNGPAESDSSFAGGTLELTTSDLPLEAAELIFGATVDSVTVGNEPSAAQGQRVKFTGSQVSPYVGYGTIVEGQENNTRYYMAFILDKIQFAKPASSFTTRGESIEWGTPSLSATVMLNDKATQDWSEWVRFSTFEAADAYVKQFLNIQ